MLFIIALTILTSAFVVLRLSYGSHAAESTQTLTLAPTSPGQKWQTYSYFSSEPLASNAEGLLQYLKAKGLAPMEIDQWKDGGWSGHPIGLPFNNFSLTQGKGYMIKFSQVPSIEWRPFENKPAKFSAAINVGWNFLGFPMTGANDDQDRPCIKTGKTITCPVASKLTAQTLCTIAGIQQLKPVEVVRLNENTQSYEHHLCSARNVNFQIDPGRGYFLLAQNPGTLSL